MDKEKINVIIGCIFGYDYEALRPFFVSLEAAGFTGEVVMQHNHISESTLEKLKSHNVTLVPISYRGGVINSWSRFWPYIRPAVKLPIGNRLRNWIYKQICNLPLVRYVHAFEYIEKNQHRYKNILFTDVRDVVFQGDPFEEDMKSEILAFEEGKTMIYGDQPLNDQWMIDNYGEDMLRRMEGNIVSCCGTIMATKEGFLKYMKAFIGEIPNLKSLVHSADMSIHNVLLRLKNDLDMEAVPNCEGAVATLVATANFGNIINPKGEVVNSSGRLVPVLHQFDRHPELATVLLERYS